MQIAKAQRMKASSMLTGWYKNYNNNPMANCKLKGKPIWFHVNENKCAESSVSICLIGEALFLVEKKVKSVQTSWQASDNQYYFANWFKASDVDGREQAATSSVDFWLVFQSIADTRCSTVVDKWDRKAKWQRESIRRAQWKV